MEKTNHPSRIRQLRLQLTPCMRADEIECAFENQAVNKVLCADEDIDCETNELSLLMIKRCGWCSSCSLSSMPNLFIDRYRMIFHLVSSIALAYTNAHRCIRQSKFAMKFGKSSRSLPPLHITIDSWPDIDWEKIRNDNNANKRAKSGDSEHQRI